MIAGPTEVDRSLASAEIACIVEHRSDGKGPKGLAVHSNSDMQLVKVEAGLCGVSLITERGTSQTKVKVPKCLLSVKQKGVFEQRQQGGSRLK